MFTNPGKQLVHLFQFRPWSGPKGVKPLLGYLDGADRGEAVLKKNVHLYIYTAPSINCRRPLELWRALRSALACSWLLTPFGSPSSSDWCEIKVCRQPTDIRINLKCSFASHWNSPVHMTNTYAHVQTLVDYMCSFSAKVWIGLASCLEWCHFLTICRTSWTSAFGCDFNFWKMSDVSYLRGSIISAFSEFMLLNQQGLSLKQAHCGCVTFGF